MILVALIHFPLIPAASFLEYDPADVPILLAAFAMALIMIPANLVLTPIYMGAPRSVVAGLLLPGIIPFNLIKAGLNSLITFVLYKRVSGILHR